MRVSPPDLRPWLLRTGAWVLALAVLWVVVGNSYERVLGTVVAKLLPANTFLVINKDTFFIGYGSPQRPLGPLLQFVSHNFGFGMALVGAIILGTSERSWRVRLAGLAAAWTLLFLSQVWVLWQAASLEAADARGELGLRTGRILLWGMYASAAVVPGALAVLWLLLPLGLRKVRERARAPDRTQGRSGKRRRRR